jgi:hypothetical protein
LGSKIHSHRYCDRKSQGIVELKPTGRTDGNQVTCATNSSNKLTSNNQFTSLFLEVAFYMYVHNFFALAQHFHILKNIFPPLQQTTL